MKCKKCKIELIENSKYCHNCGNLVMTKLSFIAEEIGEENLIAKLIDKLTEFEERLKKIEQPTVTTPWIVYSDPNPLPAPISIGGGVITSPGVTQTPGIYQMPYNGNDSSDNLPHIYFSHTTGQPDFSLLTSSTPPANSTININYINRKE